MQVVLSMQSKRTPLYIAIEEGHLEVVRLLVEKGADVNKDTYVSRRVGRRGESPGRCVGGGGRQQGRLRGT